MCPAGAVALSVGLGFVFYMAMVWWGMRKKLRTMPWRIVRVLSEGRSPYVVEIGGFGTTWNPAHPGISLAGPGVGVYRLEESGEVHLTWGPKRGPTRELLGPIPDRFRPESTDRLRRKIRRVLYLYSVLVVVGFGAGFAIVGGSTVRRIVGGGVGVLIAFIGLSFSGTVLMAARPTRTKG